MNLILPADAFRDKQMLEWIFAFKNTAETTNDEFTDLMRERFEKRVEHGSKISLLTAYQIK